MQIYLLIKEAYGYEGETEAQEITAYYNKEEAERIEKDFDTYNKQKKALNNEYERINLRCHPELNGQIGKLRKANRAKYYAFLIPEFEKWECIRVEAVELK